MNILGNFICVIIYSWKSFIGYTDHTGSTRKACLSPISLIQMYSPDALNITSKSNPIYRSSSTPEHDDDEHQHGHHHQHSDDETDYSISNIQITPSAFMNMCPALLVQIEQGSCSEHLDDPSPLPSSSSRTSLPMSSAPTQRKEVKDISSFGEDKLISPLLNIIP